MFKKFLESSYAKTAVLILGCGGVLIVFNNWIENSKIGLGFDKVNDVLMPFYIGTILAFLTCPIFNWIVGKLYKRLTGAIDPNSPELITMKTVPFRLDDGESRDMSKENRKVLTWAKIGASICVLAIVLGFFAIAFYSIIPQIIEGSGGFVETLPQRVEELTDWATTSLARFPTLQAYVLQFADTGIDEMIKWVQTNIFDTKAGMSLAAAISTGIISVFNVLFDIVIGLLLMLYLLNNKEHIFAIGRKLVAATCSDNRRDGIYEFVSIFNETFIGYIVGRILDSAVIGALTYVVLMVCNISFAPAISIIVGVTNVIPFFGPFIGAIPSVALLMLEDPKQAFYFIIIIFIIQQLDGNYIGPKIVGNALGLSSFWVLVAVLIGGGLFGFMGMAFGTPVFALIYKYVDKLAINKLTEKNKDTETSEYFTLDAYNIDASEVAAKESNKEAKARRKQRSLDKKKKKEKTTE